MRRWGAMCVALTLAGPLGCAQFEAARFARQIEGRPAPDFELSALDGGKVRLSELRGQPVLLAFWAFG